MAKVSTDANGSCQIFLSYARPDRDKVEVLHKRLLEAGHKPWMDTEDIYPGEKWKHRIAIAISGSDFFMVCLTRNSYEKRGYLQREIKQALDIWKEKLEYDIYLIPARLEECDVHEDLQDFQWVNLYENDGWERLIAAIREGIGRRQRPKDGGEQRSDEGGQSSDQTTGGNENQSQSQNDKRNLEGVDMDALSRDANEIRTNRTDEGTRRDSIGHGYLRSVLVLSPYCRDRFAEAEKLAYGIFEDSEGRYVPLPFYTSHGITHCQAVEALLDEILSGSADPNKSFIPNADEAMFLLSGAWVHDIGMMYGIFRGEQAGDLANNPDYCATLRNQHEVRTSGHLLHEWHIECQWNEDHKAILANICHFHRKKNNIDDCVPTVITGKTTGEPVRIKVIAALLRIADACHVDRSRVPGSLCALYNSLVCLQQKCASGANRNWSPGFVSIMLMGR